MKSLVVSKKDKESPQQRHRISRIYLTIYMLQSAPKSVLRSRIQSAMKFLEKAPLILRENILTVPELDSIWKSLLKTHSQMLLQRELQPLPQLPLLTQLLGFYNYLEKNYLEAATQGSINAMLALGDDYCNKIAKREEIPMETIIEWLKYFPNIFLTPGHIMAAEIYLVAWWVSIGIKKDIYFTETIRHLYIADALLPVSSAQINNAYGPGEFKELAQKGNVFRGKKSPSIFHFMSEALDAYKTREQTPFDHIGIKAIVDAELKIPDEKSEAGPASEISETVVLTEQQIRQILSKQLHEKSNAALDQYLLTTTPSMR